MTLFRAMRKSEREIDSQRAEDILNRGEYGVLSLMTEEGYPYGVPISYAMEGNFLYFHCAGEGQKIDAIVQNPSVCFTVVGTTEVLPEGFSTKYESVVVFGHADFVEGDEKRKGLELLIKKYSPQFIKEGFEYINRKFERTTVIRIKIKKISGKARD